MACKTENAYNVALYRKSLLTTVLQEHFWRWVNLIQKKKKAVKVLAVRIACKPDPSGPVAGWLLSLLHLPGPSFQA